MFSWLFIIIVSYLFFSLAFLGDKLLLVGPPNPKLYTFYVAALSILIVVFIPFAPFYVPDAVSILWILLEAVVYILGLYVMFVALEKYDASTVAPTLGAFQPIFILILTGLTWGFGSISGMNFLAFLMLFSGSVIISINRSFKLTKNYLALTVFASLMFSLDFILSKLIFLRQPFLQGLIWMRITSFLFILVFLFDKNLRRQIFVKRQMLDKKSGAIFLVTQLLGGAANILQSLAISLVPIAYLATINSLRGTQYVFLFLITLASSLFFPNILKEDISKKTIIQKTISIILIVAGLAVLISG